MRELLPKPTPRKCALRFDRDQAEPLRQLAERIKIADLTADCSAFEQAALAAERGEPLVVTFEDEAEVLQMVAGYVLHGITQPAIDDLNSTSTR